MDEGDSYCRNCGVATGRPGTPVPVSPSPLPSVVRARSTDTAKLGALIFVLCMFGACPAAFSDSKVVVVLLLLGMVVGAVMYFAQS